MSLKAKANIAAAKRAASDTSRRKERPRVGPTPSVGGSDSEAVSAVSAGVMTQKLVAIFFQFIFASCDEQFFSAQSPTEIVYCRHTRAQPTHFPN
jgi:hypothetical protein